MRMDRRRHSGRDRERHRDRDRDVDRNRDRDRDRRRDRDRDRGGSERKDKVRDWVKSLDESWKEVVRLHPPEQQRRDTVYLWEIDGALLPFQSLTDESAIRAQGWDPNVRHVAFSIERNLGFILNQRFWWREMERHDQPHINSLLPFDDNRQVSSYAVQRERLLERGRPNYNAIARRYRWIKEAYRSPNEREGLNNLVSDKSHRMSVDLFEVNKMTGDWVEAAREVIKAIKTSGGLSVIVSADKLVSSLAKLYLYRFHSMFAPEMVYASAKMGKAWCFEQIIKLYGPKTKYVILGGGKQVQNTLRVSSAKNVEYWPIRSAVDLRLIKKRLSG